jgi:hypothetical protein
MIRDYNRAAPGWQALAVASALAVEPAPPSPLERRGIDVGLSYTAEAFSLSKAGSFGRSTYYLGSFVPSLTLGLASTGTGRGDLFVSAQSLHGRGLSASRIGAIQNISNLKEEAFGRFIEAWYGDTS